VLRWSGRQPAADLEHLTLSTDRSADPGAFCTSVPGPPGWGALRSGSPNPERGSEAVLSRPRGARWTDLSLGVVGKDGLQVQGHLGRRLDASGRRSEFSPDCAAVTDTLQTRYTRSADGTNLAYQVSGDGPIDLLFSYSSFGLPLDVLGEDHGFIRVQKRLGTFSRIVWFDARGQGASEGDPRDSLAADIFDADLLAVLDAAGFDRAAMVAGDASGARAIHFSVTNAERVSALVLVNTFAHYVRNDDYPWGIPSDSLDRMVGSYRETWGTAPMLEMLAPSRLADERFRAWLARSERFSVGPDLVADLVRASTKQDVRPLLFSISVPTLVLHREGNRFIQLGAGRYLAEHIPNAKFVVLPGEDHLFFVGDTDAIVDEIEEFLTGTRSGAEGDVRTMTILFTDIVASTEHQARVGQREWSRLTDRHDAMVRVALARHRGHEVKTTGDGFLATFDAFPSGPQARLALGRRYCWRSPVSAAARSRSRCSPVNGCAVILARPLKVGGVSYEHQHARKHGAKLSATPRIDGATGPFHRTPQGLRRPNQVLSRLGVDTENGTQL
jgi:pimeloyl-ACP methyl ester carboxylesterase